MTTCDPWPITWTCDITCLSPTATGAALEAATEILDAMSGHQFGTCTTTLRPCARTCADYAPSYDWSNLYPLPALIGGKWYNLTCGTCGDDCSCTGLSEVVLPDDVIQMISVKLDGAPLVTGAYRVDNGNRLVRTDGGKWPTCQNMALPDTQPGTWSVTATFGNEVPSGGSIALGELACELSKALGGDSTCRLPRGVTQVNRQGVTINYSKVTEALKEGSTGLYLVDMFLIAHNPNRLTAPAHVYNVDEPRQRVQTWP